MFITPSRRLTAIALAAASVVGTGLSADPAGAAPGGVDTSRLATAIERAADGSVGYAYRVAAGDQLVAGGAGGLARRGLDGTQSKDGTPFTVDSRIEVQLPALQRLMPAKAKGAKARRALAKVNARVLSPAGVAPTSCKAVETDTATHIYNARNLAIGGTLVGAGAGGACTAGRGLVLSATDLVRLSPSLRGGVGGSKGGWTTTAGQSDDGQASWQSGEGEFPGGRAVNVCVAQAGGLHLSVIFNAQIPGDVSPCRILLDAVNDASTAL